MSVGAFPFPPIPPVGHVVQMRAADPLFVGVFVEGVDDIEMWYRWLRYRPVLCDGCKGVRSALDDIRRSGLKGCVGIVDADLNRVTSSLVIDMDIVVSENHDHECDLVCSPAFDTLLLSLPQAETDLATLAQPHLTLRDAIREWALPFGILRWVFHDSNVEFPNELRPTNENFVDRRTLRLNRDELFDRAANLLAVSRTRLDDLFAACHVPPGKEWDVCHGHDVVSLIRLAFATAHGAADRCRSDKSVAWALRSALDSKHLTTFAMWRQLTAWETRNVPFIVRR